MQIQATYGVAFSIAIPIIKAGGDDAAASADWTPAVGDVKVSKDRAAAANITTLPTFVSGMNAIIVSLSATEMEADEILVGIVDAATKAVKDQFISISTRIPESLRTRKAQGGTGTTITLDTGAAATDSLYNNAIVAIVGGTGAGQQRIITGYVGSTRVATVDTAWAVAPNNTSIFAIFPLGIIGLSEAQVRTALGLASANLDSQLSGIQSDTNDIQTRLPAALVSGRMDVSVGAMAANVVTAAAIATDAIDADAIAASAVTEIQSGLATAAALTTVSNAVDTEVAAIKAQTDQLAFASGRVLSDVRAVIGDPVVAGSSKTTNWGGT